MLGARVTCGSKHRLILVPTTDGLIRRPRANWTTVYMNCDLNDAQIWLKTPAQNLDDKLTVNGDSENLALDIKDNEVGFGSSIIAHIWASCISQQAWLFTGIRFFH